MSERPLTSRARTVLGAVLVLGLFVPVAGASHGDARVETVAASRSSHVRVPTLVESVLAATAAVGSIPTTAPTTTPTTTPTTKPTVADVTVASVRPRPTTGTPPPVELNVVDQLTRTVAALLGSLTPPPPLPVPSITRPATPTSSSTTLPAPTTTTTVAACRNSTDPACGPFRFDPQPGADRPMTVQVVTEPATPRAGQPMTFRLTLTDPDGVSHGSSRFFFGDSGIGETSKDPCARFGPWDPPARGPARAVEIQTVGHTYAAAGTYPTTFAFDAGPFDCTDSTTGRGDRPYASSATGTLTVVVAP